MKEIEEDTNKIKMHLLTVLKFGKSPTAELLSTGKDINGLMSREGCIIRVGVRTRAGSVVVWHVLPAKNKTKNEFNLPRIHLPPQTIGQKQDCWAATPEQESYAESKQMAQEEKIQLKGVFSLIM